LYYETDQEGQKNQRTLKRKRQPTETFSGQKRDREREREKAKKMGYLGEMIHVKATHTYTTDDENKATYPPSA